MITWWTDHRNLSDLWAWLAEIGAEPCDGPAHFMEKPWKWNVEYDAMIFVLHGKAPLNSTPEEVKQFIAEN